ncbi:hypothetical protein [Mesorhizobium sp. M0586]|uniref:hypothetical protein n=1 Tax=unclassified Mesorhizobium TaxID=325217 RepID=UPI0033397EB4
MFEPWVGERFGVADNIVGGRRVLCVGESHYAGEHPVGSKVPEMTADAMRLYQSRPAGERWVRTFDNVAWAVSGKSREELECDGKRGEFEVWSSLALYNYIPKVLAKTPRSNRPTPEQFQDGKASFEDVLQATNPQVLLIWGYELFPWIIRNHYPEYDGHPWSFAGEWIDLPRNPPMRAVRMQHPSTGYSPKAWHDVIQRAVDL